MQRLIIFIFLLLNVKAFSQLPDSTFKIKGHIAGVEKGVIFFSYSYNDKSILDSSKVIGGNFQFSGKITQPVIGYLKSDKSLVITSQSVYVFLEPTVINVELSNKPLTTIKIAGSKTHDELVEWKTSDTRLKNKFAGALDRLQTEKDTNKLKLLQDSLVLYNDQKFLLEYNFIKGHPQSYFSLYLLDAHYQNYTVAQLTDIYNNMGSKLQASIFGKQLFKHIHEMMFNSTGDIAAEIVSKDYINNKDFDLKSLKGRYVIIDFWGSWCQPCIKLLPSLVEKHKKYQNKNVVFVSVCYDYNANRDKCRDIVNRLGMNWVNLWDSQEKREPTGITSVYNVGVYPTIILIAPDGKILERGEGEYGYLKCKELLEKAFDL